MMQDAADVGGYDALIQGTSTAMETRLIQGLSVPTIWIESS